MGKPMWIAVGFWKPDAMSLLTAKTQHGRSSTENTLRNCCYY